MSEVTKNKLSKIRTGKKHGPYKNRKGVPIKEIIRLYLEEGLSCSLIAPRYSVCGAVIRDRLIEAGVALRTLSEANTLRYQRKSTGDTAIQNQRNQQDEQY